MVPAELHIEVVYSPVAGATRQVVLSLPAGSTVSDALREACPELLGQGLAMGVWGKLRALDDSLRDKDRVEIYRPLLVDPKEARRQRYQKQRAEAKR
ncbi:MAG TPA: RnfH family protein [Rhizobacter sp.]|nr:RnfH family protein [Rhizobacter sp.]